MLITPKNIEEEKKFENQYLQLYMQGKSTIHRGNVSKAVVILGMLITPSVRSLLPY